MWERRDATVMMRRCFTRQHSTQPAALCCKLMTATENTQGPILILRLLQITSSTAAEGPHSRPRAQPALSNYIARTAATPLRTEPLAPGNHQESNL